ncbi:hypothetical protein JTB14_030950 [Gonioctena quinquepunctata]|nr:hypothetical protein JTB14_030950 [Gonioctena quinquepunctata]
MPKNKKVFITLDLFCTLVREGKVDIKDLKESISTSNIFHLICKRLNLKSTLSNKYRLWKCWNKYKSSIVNEFAIEDSKLDEKASGVSEVQDDRNQLLVTKTNKQIMEASIQTNDSTSTKINLIRALGKAAECHGHSIVVHVQWHVIRDTEIRREYFRKHLWDHDISCVVSFKGTQCRKKQNGPVFVEYAICKHSGCRKFRFEYRQTENDNICRVIIKLNKEQENHGSEQYSYQVRSVQREKLKQELLKTTPMLRRDADIKKSDKQHIIK